MANDIQPIIIKKIKKAAHGHHGGAWKVAFADFVTAMMAFFMLMWLLGSTTPEQKAAIGDYFQDPMGTGGASNAVIDMGGGMNIPSGQSDNEEENYREEGESYPTFAEDLDYESDAESEAEREAQRLAELREELIKAVSDDPGIAPFLDQLLIDITNEGLRIQIVDEEKRAMFASGSATLERHAAELLGKVAQIVDAVPNRISISGHTDRRPFAGKGRAGYGNWELSADRANAARRELILSGLPEEKISRVVGLASSVLFSRDDPNAPINRRISIVVLNKATDALIQEGESSTGEAPVDAAAPAPLAATEDAPVENTAEAAPESEPETGPAVRERRRSKRS
jgi:chemotaxis protein MotB